MMFGQLLQIKTAMRVYKGCRQGLPSLYFKTIHNHMVLKTLLV